MKHIEAHRAALTQPVLMSRFYAEGMPPETPVLDDTLSSAAASAAARWVSADSGSLSLAVMREQWDTWSSNQKCFMLDKMLEMLETSSGQMLSLIHI